MKQFLIYTNRHKDEDLAVTGRIRKILEAKGCECTVKEKGEAEGFREADCMLVLGGDGTILQAAREVMFSRIPILGINLGNLGYMTEVEPENVEAALDQLLAGDYELESRMMLRAAVRLKSGEEAVQGRALNDVVITRSGPLRIIEFNIYVNGQFLKRYSADGVIVTTPTGSTGYNLSAGGPIVEPKAKLMMITPICPHTLNQRSIILSPEDRIEIEIPGGREGQSQEVEVSFDGSAQQKIHTGDRLVITRSEKTTDFIKLNKASFLEILHKKMSEN